MLVCVVLSTYLQSVLSPQYQPADSITLAHISHTALKSWAQKKRQLDWKEFNRHSSPITGLDRLWAFQEIYSSRFQDSRHMKVVRLSAVRTDRLYSPCNIPGTYFCENLSPPRSIVGPEGLCQWKMISFRGPCIVIYSYNTSQRDALFLTFIW